VYIKLQSTSQCFGFEFLLYEKMFFFVLSCGGDVSSPAAMLMTEISHTGIDRVLFQILWCILWSNAKVNNLYKNTVSMYMIITTQITPLLQYTSILPHYLANFDCLVADRQGYGDTRLTLKPSVIPNSNYVNMVSD
jgi:hypothetical protein